MQDPPGAPAVDRTGARPGETPSALGVGLAIAWLVLGSLGCLVTVSMLFVPEVAVNAAIVTVPLYTSGLAGLFGAMRTRARDRQIALGATAAAAALGFVVGLIGLGVVYFVLWPPDL